MKRSLRLSLWTVLLTSLGAVQAAPDPVLVRAVRALAAREGALKSLSGVVMQHDMRSPQQIERDQAELFGDLVVRPDPNTIVFRVPITEDGVWATRFAVAPGRCRFETLLYHAGSDDWNVSIWSVGSDGKLPPVDSSPRPSGVMTEDGQKRTAYHSVGRAAIVTPQTEWPTVAEREPVNKLLLLGWGGRDTWSRLVALLLALAGQPLADMTDPVATPNLAARERFGGLKRLPDTAVGGTACIGLEWTINAGLATPLRHRLWLAEQYGFAPMRYEEHRPLPNTPGATEAQVREAFEYKQVQPGVWLPEQTLLTTAVTGTDGKRQLHRALLSMFHDLSLEPVDPAEFKARLPLGTYVQDTTVAAVPRFLGNVDHQDAERLLNRDRQLWESPDRPLLPAKVGE